MPIRRSPNGRRHTPPRTPQPAREAPEQLLGINRNDCSGSIGTAARDQPVRAVQIDDAYLGGEKAGKVGRGAANKIPFVIAVATRKNKPVYTQLRCIPGFTKEAIKDYARANIAPGTRVISDGLACFGGVVEAGMKHTAIVTGGGRPKDERLRWTNTGLGNIKSALIGTCRSCDPQHTERYLAAIEYRFNRRFELEKMVERLARVAVQTTPKPYRSIAAVRSGAETPG